MGSAADRRMASSTSPLISLFQGSDGGGTDVDLGSFPDTEPKRDRIITAAGATILINLHLALVCMRKRTIEIWVSVISWQ